MGLFLRFLVGCMGLLLVACGGGSDPVGNGNPGGSDPEYKDIYNVGGWDSSGCTIDGYRTIKIGFRNDDWDWVEAEWMAKNLNCSIYGSVCYNNSKDSCEKYGRLYNNRSMLVACPAGWRVPSKRDWQYLSEYGFENYDGGINDPQYYLIIRGHPNYEGLLETWANRAGNRLKSSEGWKIDEKVTSLNDHSGVDSYGFTALPGGFGIADPHGGGIDMKGECKEEFCKAGEVGYWWYLNDGVGSSIVNMFYNTYNVGSWGTNGWWPDDNDYFSIRCVRDVVYDDDEWTCRGGVIGGCEKR